jgi:hypothetical protein
MTPLEIYRALEELYEKALQRETSKLLLPGTLDTNEMHTIRGRAQATKEMLAHVRNTLGYRFEEL